MHIVKLFSVSLVALSMVQICAGGKEVDESVIIIPPFNNEEFYRRNLDSLFRSNEDGTKAAAELLKNISIQEKTRVQDCANYAGICICVDCKRALSSYQPARDMAKNTAKDVKYQFKSFEELEALKAALPIQKK